MSDLGPAEATRAAGKVLVTPSDFAQEIGTPEAAQIEAILRDGVLAVLGPVLEQPGAKEIFNALRAQPGVAAIGLFRTNVLPGRIETTTFVTPGFTADDFRDINGYTTDEHVVIRAAAEVADSGREFGVAAIEEQILKGDSTTAGKVSSNGLLKLLAGAGVRYSDRFGVAPNHAEFNDAVMMYRQAVELYRTSQTSRIAIRPDQLKRQSRFLDAIRNVTNAKSSGKASRKLGRAQTAAQEARKSLFSPRA